MISLKEKNYSCLPDLCHTIEQFRNHEIDFSSSRSRFVGGWANLEFEICFAKSRYVIVE